MGLKQIIFGENKNEIYKKVLELESEIQNQDEHISRLYCFRPSGRITKNGDHSLEYIERRMYMRGLLSELKSMI